MAGGTASGEMARLFQTGAVGAASDGGRLDGFASGEKETADAAFMDRPRLDAEGRPDAIRLVEDAKVSPTAFRLVDVAGNTAVDDNPTGLRAGSSDRDDPMTAVARP